MVRCRNVHRPATSLRTRGYTQWQGRVGEPAIGVAEMRSFPTTWMWFLTLAIILCLPTLSTAQHFASSSASPMPGASSAAVSSTGKVSTPSAQHHRAWESCPTLQQGWYTPTWDDSLIGGAGNLLVGSATSAQGSPREMVQAMPRIQEHTNERVQPQGRVGETY
jgi:hypothetical protein